MKNFDSMKTTCKIAAALFLMAAALVSCEEPDLSEGRTDQVNGLMNVTIQIPGSPIEYTAEKKGPYAEGEEIIVKLPTSDEAPTDVTKLKMTASLEHNCYINEPLGKYLDFTEPYRIEVTDVLGNVHHNSVKVVLLPPKTRFEVLWTKSNAELGIPSQKSSGMALNDRYVAVQEWGGDGEGFFTLFDLRTGTLFKQYPSARSFMMKCNADDAGHFVVCRENIYGAGFMVFLFEEETETYKLLLDYTAGDGAPEDLGYEMSVCGDVTSGKAYIYGMAPGTMTIYYWELLDGELVTPASQPKTLRYGPAKKEWTRAQIQRASLSDNSEHYISYLQMGVSETDGQGSRFNIFTPSMDVKVLNPKNTLYKILDFKVFNIGEDQYLVTNEQNFTDWSENLVRVYDITDRSRMEMIPDDEGYNKFLLFESECIYPTNYNRWGDVDVTIEETETGYVAYIASSVVGYDTKESCIRMFKMTYNRQ